MADEIDPSEIDALFEGGGNGSNPFRPSRDVLVQGVNRTADFERIVSLPRRAEAMPSAAVEQITEYLKTDQIRAWDALRASPPHNWRTLLPEGRDPNVESPRVFRLRPIQALALKDSLETGGLFAPIGVGHGKFLISTLLVVLVTIARKIKGRDPGRWLLLVPANLLAQTHAEIARMRLHFRMPATWPAPDAGNGVLRVETYEKLSSAKSSRFYSETLADGGYEPTDVISDEMHKLKRMSAARTRKFLRRFRETRGMHFYGMSGSITRESIRDYWHLIHLACRHAPLPRSFPETEQWSQALDDSPDNGMRRAPGALLELCAAEEIDAIRPGWSTSDRDDRLGYYGETPERQAALLQAVRRGFRRRLVETPGVVATSEGSLGTSLVISERVPPAPPRAVEEAFSQLRNTWQTPNGDEIDSPISLWRHACELASGFWYRWEPPAPKEWLFARGEWNKFVRKVLAHNRQRLDSPLQVAQAVARGDLSPAFGPGAELQAAWRAVRDTFEPNPVPNWISPWLVQDVLRWFAEQTDDDGNPAPGIAWVNLSAFGEEVARQSGGAVRYFGGGAEASEEIRDYRGPLVASVAAHGTGKNLQWCARNLIVHPPSGGDVWEQLLGRTHRQGQEADEVRVDFYGHALELREAFKHARRAARYIEDSTGAVQKLTYATVTMRDETEIEALASGFDPLWTKLAP